MTVIELTDDDWIRDVSTMLGAWVIATLLASGALLAYGFGTGAF